jgi:hypothetical protein
VTPTFVNFMDNPYEYGASFALRGIIGLMADVALSARRPDTLDIRVNARSTTFVSPGQGIEGRVSSASWVAAAGQPPVTITLDQPAYVQIDSASRGQPFPPAYGYETSEKLEMPVRVDGATQVAEGRNVIRLERGPHPASIVGSDREQSVFMSFSHITTGACEWRDGAVTISVPGVPYECEFDLPAPRRFRAEFSGATRRSQTLSVSPEGTQTPDTYSYGSTLDRILPQGHYRLMIRDSDLLPEPEVLTPPRTVQMTFGSR